MTDLSSPRASAYSIAVTVLVCGAVLSPIYQGFLPDPVDDFPLSWYPMFARPRPELEHPVYVVAVDPDGTRHKVGQAWWTSGGFNQGATQLIQAANAGDSRTIPLCARIATRIGRRRPAEYEAATEIRILEGAYSRERWFRDGDHTPEREKVVQRCPIGAP